MPLTGKFPGDAHAHLSKRHMENYALLSFLHLCLQTVAIFYSLTGNFDLQSYFCRTNLVYLQHTDEAILIVMCVLNFSILY